jgi:molybdopterin-synthase adenylyltransferase
MPSKFLHEELQRGEGYLAKIAKPKVVVCGAGALGSNLVDTLARMGFRTLKVIDHDRITEHNISTQIWAQNDIGALKVQTLAARVFRTAGVEILDESKRLDKDNVHKLLRGADLVVDCFDNAESRSIVKEYCGSRLVPCVHAGMIHEYGEVIWEPLYQVPQDTEGDPCDYPLARNLVILVVHVLAEEVVDFFTNPKPRLGNWSITLKDLQINRLLLGEQCLSNE